MSTPKPPEAASAPELDEFPQGEYERELLGILMYDGTGDDVRRILKPEHFFFDEHAAIYSEMVRLWDAGETANPVTMRHWADSESLLDSLFPHAGAKYLVYCLASQVGWLKPAAGAKELIKRANMNAAYDIAEDLRDNMSSGAALPLAIARAKKSLDEIVDPGAPAVVSWEDAVVISIEAAERAYKEGFLGVNTGLKAVDNVTGGFRNGDLIIAAGRTGMGKSLFAQAISAKVAQRGLKVFYKSCEMSLEQIGHRALAMESGVPYFDIRAGDLNQRQWGELHAAHQKISGDPIVIDSMSLGTVSSIHQTVRAEQEQGDIGLVVIDYLQLLRPEANYRGNKVAEIEEISGLLKIMAVDLNVPLLVLSQLSRAPTERNDKRPILSDLRWSGAIEQDADMVLFLHRDHYYDTTAPEYELEVNIAKNRNGETAKVTVFADMKTGRMGNIETRDYE